MKKVVILVALMVAAVVSANAQILRAEELEEYAKERYGDKWVDAAANLGAELTLDKNNALTYVQVIEAPGKDSHKKTSSKALIMAHAYSNVVMDKIEECIKNGLTGNESDDW